MNPPRLGSGTLSGSETLEFPVSEATKDAIAEGNDLSGDKGAE